MAIEDELRERLRKVEALLFGATTAGEREAVKSLPIATPFRGQYRPVDFH